MFWCCCMKNTAFAKRISFLLNCALCPAYEAMDIGLDRSMIGAYGQDDRVCAYAALRALLDVGQVKRQRCACWWTRRRSAR